MSSRYKLSCEATYEELYKFVEDHVYVTSDSFGIPDVTYLSIDNACKTIKITSAGDFSSIYDFDSRPKVEYRPVARKYCNWTYLH